MLDDWGLVADLLCAWYSSTVQYSTVQYSTSIHSLAAARVQMMMGLWFSGRDGVGASFLSPCKTRMSLETNDRTPGNHYLKMTKFENGRYVQYRVRRNAYCKYVVSKSTVPYVSESRSELPYVTLIIL
jgi:hypothetical protein